MDVKNEDQFLRLFPNSFIISCFINSLPSIEIFFLLKIEILEFFLHFLTKTVTSHLIVCDLCRDALELFFV